VEVGIQNGWYKVSKEAQGVDGLPWQIVVRPFRIALCHKLTDLLKQRPELSMKPFE
jgi:hypothetical protein